jgi:8-oxo-dGTP pyrophosphatase MutT (NUDIX family)
MAKSLTTCGIFLYSRQTKTLLICHPTNARWNRWSIPKGLAENGKDDYIAASRELFEETGISVKILGDVTKYILPEVLYKKQKKTLRSFLLVTDQDLGNHVFKSSMVENLFVPEIDAWKWVKLEEAGKYLMKAKFR